jgi:hypothetical protein
MKKQIVVCLALIALVLSGCGRQSLREELTLYRRTVLAPLAAAEAQLEANLSDLEAAEPTLVASGMALEFLEERFVPTCCEILSYLATHPPAAPELVACHRQVAQFYRDAARLATDCSRGIHQGDTGAVVAAMDGLKALDIGPVLGQLESLYRGQGVTLD